MSKTVVVVTRWFDKDRQRPIYEVRPVKGKFSETEVDTTDTLDVLNDSPSVESANWGARELLVFCKTTKVALKRFDTEVPALLRQCFTVKEERVSNDTWRPVA